MVMRWSAILAWLFAAALLALAACERGPAAKSAGGEAGAGPRIVALSPAAAQIVRDLGLGARLVGRHGFDTFSDPALAVCGDQAGIDYEALLGARPTHVLLQWGQRERPARLTQLAATNRWSVHDYPLLALADVDDAAAEMAALWGVATLPPIRGLEAGKRPDRAAVGRVLLLYGIDPPSALGPGSFHHELLVDLGATPALTEGRAFMTLDAEDVLRLAPDAVMIFNPRAAGRPASNVPPAELVKRLGALGRLDVPAFRAASGGVPRVVLIDDPMCATPGTNLRGLRAEMAGVVDGWAKR